MFSRRSVFPSDLFNYGVLNKPRMLESVLTCCKLYISENRGALALKSIDQASKAHPEALVLNKFKDEVYNRVGYTIVSQLAMDVAPIRNAVFDMVRAALASINLDLHSGSHPRLGVVNHICFHPLAQASLDQVVAVAKSVATDIVYKLKVPIYLYGAAHEGGRTLDSIRRELGYFKPNSAGNQWTCRLKTENPMPKRDAGPLQHSPTTGVLVVGATWWVDNYNVPVWCTDTKSVQRIARKISERGGVLKSVQAMALNHGEGCMEVACNLLDSSITGEDKVQAEVERLALEEGFKVGEGYFTDFSQEKIVEMYFKSVSCGF